MKYSKNILTLSLSCFGGSVMVFVPLYLDEFELKYLIMVISGLLLSFILFQIFLFMNIRGLKNENTSLESNRKGLKQLIRKKESELEIAENKIFLLNAQLNQLSSKYVALVTSLSPAERKKAREIIDLIENTDGREYNGKN